LPWADFADATGLRCRETRFCGAETNGPKRPRSSRHGARETKPAHGTPPTRGYSRATGKAREDSNLQPSGYAPVVCHCPAAAESYWNLNKIGVLFCPARQSHPFFQKGSRPKALTMLDLPSDSDCIDHAPHHCTIAAYKYLGQSGSYLTVSYRHGFRRQKE
jgi:hypothetical protein